MVAGILNSEVFFVVAILTMVVGIPLLGIGIMFARERISLWGLPFVSPILMWLSAKATREIGFLTGAEDSPVLFLVILALVFCMICVAKNRVESL